MAILGVNIRGDRVMASFQVFPFTIPHKPRIRIRDKTAIICKQDNLPTIVNIHVEYVPGEYIAELDSLHKFFAVLARKTSYLLEEYAFNIYKEMLSRLMPLELEVEVCGTGVGHGEACIEYSWKYGKEN